MPTIFSVGMLHDNRKFDSYNRFLKR